MESVTPENPRRFSRREVLRAGLTVAAAVGVSQLASSKSQGLENTQGGEPVPPRRWMPSSLPTVGHDVVFISPETNLFIPSPHQEPTPTAEENITAEAKPVVAEAKPLVVEEEKNPLVVPKESGPEYNLLNPEAFAPYASMGGPETSGEEILDYFPQSYNDAPDSLKGLWSRAIDAKLRDKPQTNVSLPVEMATLPEKISFDYLLVTEGTKFFDIQEQEERIMPCESNVVVMGKIDGENNLLAIYQEPVNSCYYFAKVGEDVLKGQEDLTASKNLVVEGFSSAINKLSGIGTEEERKRLYEVKEGESLDAIASSFGLPSWHALYGKNLETVGSKPTEIVPGQRLMIPDQIKDQDLIEFLMPDKEPRLSGDNFNMDFRSLIRSENGHLFVDTGLDQALAAIDREGIREEFEARTVRLLVFGKDYDQFRPATADPENLWMRLYSYLSSHPALTADKVEIRDFLSFEFFSKESKLNFTNAYALLALYRVKFEENQSLNQALIRLAEGSKVINEMIRRVPSDLFVNDEWPQLPQEWQGKFAFVGGEGYGGSGYLPFPVLFGPYYQEGKEDEFLRNLVESGGLHEAIHSLIQPASKAEHSQWWSEEKPEDPNFVPEDARKGLLAHMSMCILTSAAQRYYGFEEKRDPRIDYILKVLEQEGVDNPEAEMIQAAATFNGDNLWDVYEKARKENDPSMDSLMSTQEPDLVMIRT